MGGGSLKVGFAGDEKPKIIDNCIFKSKTLSGRTFIGDEIEECGNLSSLFCIMPFKKGYLNDWDVQTKILDSVLPRLFRQNRQYAFSDCNLLVTEPYFNFPGTKEAMNEVFFEEYQFSGLIRTNPALLAAYKYQSESVQRLSRYCLVIDSGYSFTHLIPMGDGRMMSEFVLRLNVGGKILTNRLVDIISYRHLDVRSELHIINQCKEDVCYVSTNFWGDLDLSRSNPSRNPILREYVLPDYAEVPRGYVRIPNQEYATSSDLSTNSVCKRSTQQGYVLSLSNERFTVPELLFHPGDVGFREMGLTEAMGYLMCERLPPAVRPGAWANILVIGGSACLPGFRERLNSDLRHLPPDDLAMNIFIPNNPRTYAWEGGSLLAQTKDDLMSFLVTRAEYDEGGSAYCERRFPVS